jgi:hypothetical protein
MGANLESAATQKKGHMLQSIPHLTRHSQISTSISNGIPSLSIHVSPPPLSLLPSSTTTFLAVDPFLSAWTGHGFLAPPIVYLLYTVYRLLLFFFLQPFSLTS